MSDSSSKPSFWSKVKPSHWIAVILVLLAILFVVQNRGPVSVELFWLSVQSPQWLILALMFGVGWVSGYLATRRRANAKQAAAARSSRR